MCRGVVAHRKPVPHQAGFGRRPETARNVIRCGKLDNLQAAGFPEILQYPGRQFAAGQNRRGMFREITRLLTLVNNADVIPRVNQIRVLDFT